MKNQGVVKFFAIALVLVCIYQLSFTVKAIMLDNEIEEATHGDPVLKRKYIDSIAAEKVFDLGFTSYTYLELKEQQLNLGLDLQGGMNVVLEISVPDIIQALSNSNTPAFNEALAKAIQQKELNPGIDLIDEFRKQFNTLAPNVKLSSVFFSKENSDRINIASSDDEVVAFLRSQADDAVGRSFKILEARIDQFGVTQPTIQMLANSNRVMVELPGVDNPERVRKLLQNTAKLEFWNVYSNYEMDGIYKTINATLKAKFASDSALMGDTANSVTPTIAPTIDSTTLQATNDTTTNDSIRRADSLARAAADTTEKQLTEAEARREYPLFAKGLIQVTAEQNGQQVLREGPTVGIAHFKDTATINGLLSMPEVMEAIGDRIKFAWDYKAFDDNKVYYYLYALKPETDGGCALEGDVVTNARTGLDQTGKIEISMDMNQVGTGRWAQITEAAAKTTPQSAVAIVLDGLVYSAPTVNGKIENGSSRIMGSFTQEEATDLANILKAGKMPAKARIVQEAIVGPSLGQSSINSSLISIIVGFLSVILIMFIVYNTAGIIADLAVLLNLFFIIGTLASLHAALTLPGIAGVILTLGMAVDANVLIYERIKEELDQGRNLRNAISNGFKNASSAIIDSNVTTALAGVVLMVFGSGPIAGFAVTLIIGIVSSLFTAFLLTRVVYEWMMKREKNVKFWFPFSHHILRNSNFDFVGRSKIFYTISGIVILAGIASMVTKGFDLGVDFKGGWSYTVKIEKPTAAPAIREAMKGPLEAAPEVKVFGEENSFKITTSYLINSTDTAAARKVEAKIAEGFSALNAGKYEILTSDKVGPTVADDIKQSAIISIIVALIGMFIYIQIRFRRWQFALATIVMLVHDVLLVLSLFSLLWGVVPFTMEIDQAFIAAILTVIGYSINDSVVVFDRVREFLREHKHEEDTGKVINMALNKTLSRTIMTSLTTIIVVFILFVFGGDTIKGFAFALTVGIILGTYSSLCIGSPLSAQLIQRAKKKN